METSKPVSQPVRFMNPRVFEAFGPIDHTHAVAASPFRNVEYTDYAGLLHRLESPEFLQFLIDARRLARGLGVFSAYQVPQIGLWFNPEVGRVVFEPSLMVMAAASEAMVLRLAAALGQRYDQQAVYLVHPHPVGRGSEYRITFATRRAAFDAAAQLPRYGIEGASISRRDISIGDKDERMKRPVSAFFKAARGRGAVALRRVRADIRLLWQADYGRVLGEEGQDSRIGDISDEAKLYVIRVFLRPKWMMERGHVIRLN